MGHGARVGLTLLALAVAGAGCGDDAIEPGSGADAVEDAQPDSQGTTDPGPGADAEPESGPEPEAEAGCGEGDPCDDGDACTVDDQCDAAGACAGVAMDCDDGLACTEDSCAEGACEHALMVGSCLFEGACVSNLLPQPGNACQICDGTSGEFVAVEDGGACSDGDACTTGDACVAGACEASGTLACESEDVCLTASCDPELGCLTTKNSAPCDDGDPCTLGDLCDDGACTSGTEELACEADDPCLLEVCEAGVGCVEAGAKCQDGDACTEDACDGGECTFTAFVGPCEDGDPCTAGEACDAGGTCAGGADLDCDDGNPCTDDACDPLLGCLNLFNEAPCDDGAECTSPDLCVAGQCVGEKNGCPSCPLPVTDHANRVVQMLVSADGNPGSGLDVDDNPETCAPAGSCAGGIDNALSVLAALINDPLADGIEDGNLFYVTDLDAATYDGEPFPFAVYDCEPGIEAILDGCDYLTESCGYTVDQTSFDPTCKGYFSVDNAKIEGTALTAGGTGDILTIVFALGGATVPLAVAKAKVEGTVTIDPDSGLVTQILGVIGGAVPKAQLKATLEGVDPSILPIDKDLVLAVIDDVVEDDVDLDGDGVYDAASIGIRFKTIPATLVAN